MKDNLVMERLWARRRLLSSFVLCVLVAALAAVIIAPRWHMSPRISASRLATATVPKPTATWRPTYSIIPDGPIEKAYHQGDQLMYGWSSQLDPSPRSSAPGTLTCTFALYGPYANETDADRASQTDLSTVTASVSAPPLILDRWTSKSHPEMLILPGNLPLGYYIAMSRVVESDAGGTGRTTMSAAIIQILG